ncbi:MAG: Ca-activated chloride channel family protein [Myxococcota bacterium]|jgi:hypothetical protein
MNFLAPLGLAAAALTIPLVAMYFLKLRRKKVKVPSLLLWQQFHKSEQLASPFERFRRNLMLLLQLLALLLLVLALSRPYLTSEAPLARSLVMVVDTSASMGATDVSPNRLGSAVDRAHDLVSSMSSSDEGMLIVAGPRTEVTVPFTRDKSALHSGLDALAASEARGALREGVQLAVSMARSRPGVEVVVLSDGGADSLADVPTGGAAVTFIPVGRSDDNAAIVAVDLRRSPSSELERQLFVTTQNYGGDDQEGTVEVYLDGELIGLRTENLPPDTPVSFVFDVGGDKSGTIKVTLAADDDYLESDNTAWLALARLSQRRITLIGGDSLTARALQADPRVTLRRFAPGPIPAQILDNSDAIVFAGGNVPDGLEGRNVLILGPLPGSMVELGDEVRSPLVLGWRRTHPVLRFVEWDQIIISRTQKVTDNRNLVAIVDSDEGPLVLAGEVAGGRVVQLAFDPLRSDLPLRVAWPVTLLNAVGWLTENSTTGEAAQAIPTGAPFVRRLPDGTPQDSVRVIGPDGNDVDVQVADDLLRVRDTSQVGVYELRIGAVRSAFAANLLSPDESEIVPRPDLILADSVVEASLGATAGRRELWRWLLALSIVALFIEWFAYNRRRAA